VTDRRKAERALRESELRFRQLVEQAADAFFLFDRSGRILDINRSAAEQLGFDRPVLMQQSLADLMPDESDASLASLWNRLVPGEPVTLERTLRRRDGSLFPAELRLGRIDLQGEDLALALSRDLTERREMETRLRQREKMEAIGQLAGGIAHDFNNQLAGIMGCADLLRARVTEEDQKRLTELIVTSSERASDLTAKLLAFARRGKYRVMPVDVHQVLTETAALLEHSIDKSIRIRLELGAERSVTKGDPTQLQSAFLNIALNARDAMPDGGTLIFRSACVELGPEDCEGRPYEIEPGPHLRVVVADTGCGIPPHLVERIFEPFYTTKPEGQGTGMGLPAVYGTIKNHKGLIDLRSETGAGTEVAVCLPLAEAELRAPEPESGPAAAPPGPPARILVVDDEEIVREMASEMLQALGYEVRSVADGHEAIALYEEAWPRFDLVILDMVMPEMGGRELFIRMREINPDIRALLATGYSLDGRSQEILREGVRAFIQKPFRSVELARRVGEVLAGDAVSDS
jgi:PAS domain S-box-containing protein